MTTKKTTSGTSKSNAKSPVKNTKGKSVAKKPVKKKGKPRGGNNILLKENNLIGEPGSYTKLMKKNTAIYNLQATQPVDLHDYESIRTRIIDYFNICAENDTTSTITGIALALGMSRQTLWEIAHDKSTGKYVLPKNCTDLIKNMYFYQDTLWEDLMTTGTIHPTAGIFIGRNHFKYQDKIEHVVVAKTNTEDINAEEIKDRYLSDKAENKIIDVDVAD